MSVARLSITSLTDTGGRLSYYGMDSTYASSLAILRRILRLEGILG